MWLQWSIYCCKRNFRGNNIAHDKKLALKNNATFISCIIKINNTLTDDAEDLYI